MISIVRTLKERFPLFPSPKERLMRDAEAAQSLGQQQGAVGALITQFCGIEKDVPDFVMGLVEKAEKEDIVTALCLTHSIYRVSELRLKYDNEAGKLQKSAFSKFKKLIENGREKEGDLRMIEILNGISGTPDTLLSRVAEDTIAIIKLRQHESAPASVRGVHPHF